MSLQVSVVDTQEKLLAIKPEWEQLAGDNPFLSWDWADTWWQHYRSPQTMLLVLAVRDERGQLAGLAPWTLGNALTRGKVIRFIGANEVCGDRLTVLAADENQRAVVQTIAQWLRTDAKGLWDLVELTGVEQSNQRIAHLSESLSDTGHLVHQRQDLNCWKISLPTTWEAYLATLSRARRNRTRRLLKNTIDAGVGCQRKVTSPQDFEAGFDILIDLHQKRRNMLAEPGCFASDRYRAFHHEFAQRMLCQNRLRLCWVELAGRPAAVEYSLLGHRTIYNYQSGFEPAMADEHPGWINLVASLRWAISEGYSSFDMLRGDEAYKASFGAQPEPLLQVRIVGQRCSARLRHAAWRTQSSVKRWARDGLKFASELRKTQATPVDNFDRQSADAAPQKTSASRQ